MKCTGFAVATCAAGALRKAAVTALPGQIIVRELKLKSVLARDEVEIHCRPRVTAPKIKTNLLTGPRRVVH